MAKKFSIKKIALWIWAVITALLVAFLCVFTYPSANGKSPNEIWTEKINAARKRIDGRPTKTQIRNRYRK